MFQIIAKKTPETINQVNHMVTPSSYAIVWYWKGEGVSFPKLGKPNYSPGHVALQLHTGKENEKDAYISFWSGRCGLVNPEHCQETDSHFHAELSIDQLIEKKRGEDIKLVSLNVDAMRTAFEQFRRKPFSWGALGSGIFRKSYERNCSGLTLFLLEKGGIKKHHRNTDDNFTRRVFSVITTLEISYRSYWSFRQFRTLTSILTLNPSLKSDNNELLLTVQDDRTVTNKALHYVQWLSQRAFKIFIETLCDTFYVHHDQELSSELLLSLDPLYNYHKLVNSYLLGQNRLHMTQEKVKKVFLLSVKALLQIENSPDIGQVIRADLTKIVKKSLESLKSLDADISINKKFVLPSLIQSFTYAKKSYLYATAASLVSIALTITLIYLNRDIWSKTVTPADVEKIVRKAQANEKT